MLRSFLLIAGFIIALTVWTITPSRFLGCLALGFMAVCVLKATAWAVVETHAHYRRVQMRREARKRVTPPGVVRRIV